jgi:hypothetical protein
LDNVLDPWGGPYNFLRIQASNEDKDYIRSGYLKCRTVWDLKF